MHGYQFLGIPLEAVVEEQKLLGSSSLNVNDSAAHLRTLLKGGSSCTSSAPYVSQVFLILFKQQLI